MNILQAKDLPKSFFSYRDADVDEAVREIVQDVKLAGDKALRKYTAWFDGVELTELACDPVVVKAAYEKITPESIAAMKKAAENIRRFAEFQLKNYQGFEVELQPGVITGQRVQPIERVGVYAPGGRFPLVSSLLMGAIPAKAAGVGELVICSPPGKDGQIHPAILVAADIVGTNEIYRVGGAQAIAAMAYGTDSIHAVDKIVGPGNKYVAQAKKEVYGAVGIDLIAGPTEVLIIADENANPNIIAADLLAQAEHDIDASAVLLTDSQTFAERVQKAMKTQLADLKNKETAIASIEQNGVIAIVKDWDEAINIANRKGPEHLEVQLKDVEKLTPKLKNFGALFIGEMAAEVLGDYSSGINHTLPTNTTARYRGGLGVQDFLKIQSTLRVTEAGFAEIAPVAEAMAVAEGLSAHAKAIQIRKAK